MDQRIFEAARSLENPFLETSRQGGGRTLGFFCSYFLTVQYDLVDPRITSPEEIRDRIAHFMESVMAESLSAA